MYTVQKDKIVIKDIRDFNITHILECGQVFRYKKTSESTYRVFSLDKYADIKTYDDRVEILTDDIEYFAKYFDLDTDYSAIKSSLSKYEQLKEPLQYGYGIRILKQDFFEMIISFIISANNNIKRIQGIIERICDYCGKDMGGYHAFPTIDELMTCTESDFKRFGAGYRAMYLYKVCRQLKELDLDELRNEDTLTLRKSLSKLMGVGPKVADCILLFGLGRKDVFPVDTWIMKVYKDIFNGSLTNRNQISDFLVDFFGELAGYAQQYLFYFKREED